MKNKKKNEVVFVCNHTQNAKKVYLAGSFNNWDPKAKQMVKAKDGSFRARMQLPSGDHQYKFVADGLWLNDPTAATQVPNSFGTQNSVIRVE